MDSAHACETVNVVPDLASVGPAHTGRYCPTWTLDLLATLTDEAIAAEVEASAYAGRSLTPAEVVALVRRR